LEVKRREQNVMVQIDNSVKQAQSDFERVDATRQARIYAEAALEAEQKKLENGKSTSFEVLRLQRDLTTAASQEIRALADYNNDLSQLAFWEGTTLERRRVSVEVK
jgi:outer membrane protein TolC